MNAAAKQNQPETRIMIPHRTMHEGREFERLETNGIENALRDCQEAGYDPQFMPALADARIEAPGEARIWQPWYTTPSLRATGKTQQGNPVVVYAHVPNYFSNSDNITTAREAGLRNGAGRMPREEFQRLLDLKDDETVFVVDYNTLKNSPSDVIKVSNALKHPQTIPFLGGQERAESYLRRHEQVYQRKDIGIWHSDDLADEPMARVLALGVNNFDDGLNGNNDLNYLARFVGVRRGASAPENKGPTEEQLCRIIGEYVAPVNQLEVNKRIGKLFP